MIIIIWHDITSEGDKDKGRIFMDANKKTIILNTKIHLGYGFPCEPGTSRNQRLNDVRNNAKMTQKMMKPVLKAIRLLNHETVYLLFLIVNILNKQCAVARWNCEESLIITDIKLTFTLMFAWIWNAKKTTFNTIICLEQYNPVQELSIIIYWWQAG